MKQRIATILLFVSALFASVPALAQTPATVKLCIPTSGTVCPQVTATNPLPVTGTFSATLAGFTPNGNFATLTATAASSASTALPAGVVVGFQNLSSVDVSCVLSAGAATATTNKILIRAGATVFLTVGTNVNTACINQTGSASNVVALVGGSGLGTNFGGGGGGSGGGTSSAFDAAFPANGTAIGLSDGTNMKAWLTALIQAKTAVNGNNMGSVANWLYNAGATSFDAAPGDATNGAWVNVKTSVLPTGAATSANQASQITQETATATAAGTPTDSPCTAPASATSCTMEALLKALLNVGQYPSGATAITASATGTTAATTATLAGAVGKTTYICGYSIRANATAAATVTNTITGVITATLSSIMWVAPLASGIGVDEQIFNPCIPASATNTGIAIVSGAPGSGGTVSAKGWGYQL